MSGKSARLVAKYRPKQPIMVVCKQNNVATQSMGILKGVRAVLERDDLSPMQVRLNMGWG